MLELGLVVRCFEHSELDNKVSTMERLASKYVVRGTEYRFDQDASIAAFWNALKSTALLTIPEACANFFIIIIYYNNIFILFLDIECPHANRFPNVQLPLLNHCAACFDRRLSKTKVPRSLLRVQLVWYVIPCLFIHWLHLIGPMVI